MNKRKVLFIVLSYLQLSEEFKAGYWGNKYARKKAPSSLLKSWPAPPYGALSVVTYNKEVANIRILDCNIANDYSTNIIREMKGFKPDIVGFAMTFDNSYMHLQSILEMIRRMDPEVITVIGGAATIPAYKDILDEQENMDAVCYADGELPFRRLLESDSPRDLLKTDPSWITRYSMENGRVPQKSVVENIDDIIELDYSFINIKNYLIREEFSPFAEMAINRMRFPLFTSRGCPFRCSFCYRSREDDRKMRYASIDKVIGHVRYLVEHYGMKYLTLCDDQLLVNMKRIKEIFRQLEQFHLRVEIYQGASVAFIDDEMAYLMKIAGIVRVVLAIESGSQYVLDKMVDKPVNLNKAKDVIKILRKHGLWIEACFVMGFPGETDEHRAETLRWVEEAEPDWSAFSAAVPIRGTKLYDMCMKGGYIKSDIKLGTLDYSNYFINTPGYSPEYIAKQIYNMNLLCNFVNNYQVQNGDFGTAAKAFGWVINVYEGHAFAHYYLAECLRKLGKSAGAQRHMNRFDEIINKDPKWAEYARDFKIGV